MRTKLPLYVRKASLPMPGVDYELDLPAKHLSYSQISLYLQCPSQYSHKYVLGMSTPNSVYFFEGKCLHHVLEQTGNRWSKKGKHLNYSDAEKEYGKYFNKNEGGVEEWFGIDPDEVSARANSFLKILFDENRSPQLLDVIQPRMIGKKPGTEIRWKKDFAGVPVIGVTDLLTEKRVWDYKVVGKTPDADNSLQLSFYSAAHDIANVGFFAFLKTKTPSVKLIPTIRKPRKTKQWLDAVVSRVALGISKKIWTPCEGELSWWCSEKWCSVWKECRGF